MMFSEKELSEMSAGQLIGLVESVARVRHDGRFFIMAADGVVVAAFGTPDLASPAVARAQISMASHFGGLQEALSGMINKDRWSFDEIIPTNQQLVQREIHHEFLRPYIVFDRR